MPLTPFRKWLTDRGMAYQTVRTYASEVRQVFRSPEEGRELIADPDRARRAILETDAAILPPTRCSFRGAIRAFDAYLISIGCPAILPIFPDGRKKDIFDPDRDPLAKLRFLAPLLRQIQIEANPDMPWSRLAERRWKDTRSGGTPCIIVQDVQWCRAYTLPREPLMKIAHWASGLEKFTPQSMELLGPLPIVPREPLSLHPLPSAILRRLANQG